MGVPGKKWGKGPIHQFHQNLFTYFTCILKWILILVIDLICLLHVCKHLICLQYICLFMLTVITPIEVLTPDGVIYNISETFNDLTFHIYTTYIELVIFKGVPMKWFIVSEFQWVYIYKAFFFKGSDRWLFSNARSISRIIVFTYWWLVGT